MVKEDYTPQEQWAETEAKFCDQMVEDYKRMASEWAANAENYMEAQRCATYAEAYDQMARNLRKSRNCRLENERF